MVEQRYQAVREVLDTGATITDVALRYGVDRTTLHHWLRRGRARGVSDQVIQTRLLPSSDGPGDRGAPGGVRRSHPRWGPRTLWSKLRAKFDPAPSRSAIYRALFRHQLIAPTPRRHSKDRYRRFERNRSMVTLVLCALELVLRLPCEETSALARRAAYPKI